MSRKRTKPKEDRPLGQSAIDWREFVEQLDRQKPKETVEAVREYERELTKAWDDRPQESPLATLIRDDDISVKDIAKALRRQYAPRGQGKPGGVHTRWLLRHYVVAWLVEGTAPRDRRGLEERISHWIDTINDWAAWYDEPELDPETGGIDHERVLELLRKSKRQRL